MRNSRRRRRSWRRPRSRVTSPTMSSCYSRTFHTRPSGVNSREGAVNPSSTWRQLYVDFSSNRVAKLGAAQLDKCSIGAHGWWMLLHRSNTNIIHDMQLYRYIYTIYRPYTYTVILLLTPCACCSEALTKLPRILHKCKPASSINQSIDQSYIHIHPL